MRTAAVHDPRPSCRAARPSPRVAPEPTGERETDGVVNEAHPVKPDHLPTEVPALIVELGVKRAAEDQRRGDHEERARSTIHTLHLAAREQPIRIPDAEGAFPTRLLGGTTLVVVDANTLRNDVIYACREDGARTTLLTGANSDMLRLFCARHVLEEVKEHHFEWCEEAGVPADTFLRVFRDSYAPLLRAVRDVPEGLLSADEQARVEELRRRDPDDIPSVTLAMLLEAFYMSEDLAASKAVYGREVTRNEARRWVDVLRAGADAGMVGSVFQVAGIIPMAVGAGLWEGFDRLTRQMNGWARLGLALFATSITGGVYLYRRQPEERRQTIREGFLNALELGGAFVVELERANSRLARAVPDQPDWDQLLRDRDRSQVLTRACLHRLARSRRSHLSAVELAEELPRLGIGQSATAVRTVLRDRLTCFEEVYTGRWQVGRALVRAPTTPQDQ